MRRDGSHRQGGDAPLALRSWLRPRTDPYDAVDFTNASRIGALIAIVVSFVEAVALALGGTARPIATVGAAALVLLPAAVGWRLIATDRLLGPVGLLVLPWAGALQVAALAVLVEERLVVRVGIFWLLFAAAIHPPRRLALLVAAMGGLAFALLTGRESADLLAMDLVICVALTAVAFVLLHALRSQRVALRDDHRHALALSQRDPLTGLGNRRALDEALGRETARARRSGSSFAVAVIDVDDFKAINDRFGHLEGDRCLVEVARTIERSVRVPDACFRWGGDEFVVLLPEAGQDGAVQLLHRLRGELNVAARTPDGEPVHASAAIAASGDASPAEVLDAADRALLELKQDAPVQAH